MSWHFSRSISQAIGAGMVAAVASLVMQGAAAAGQTVCTPTWTTSESANTTALQSAIDTCSAAGTATLPGLVKLAAQSGISTAQIAPVTLKSNIVVKVEAGFTLKGPDPADVGYTGTGSSAAPPLLGGSHVSNVTITGTGVIDGNGQAYWDIFNQGGSFMNQDRPRIIKLTGTGLKVGANFSNTGQSIEGVTFPTWTNRTTRALKIKNSPKMHVTFESGSSNILVDGVWIFAPTGRADLGTGTNKNIAPNTDGIDLIGVNSSNLGTAVVQNCLIDTGDDDIAIKSNSKTFPTYNVSVRNCVFGGGHGLSIGGQETGGVFNTAVTNVWFKGTDFGFKVKTDNSSKDSGVTNGATYTNSCMLDVGEPIQLTYNYNGSASGGQPPTVENISYDNIVATSASTQGVSAILGEVFGLVDDSLWRNIKITNSRITGSDAQPFTVTYGVLNLGTHSNVATMTGAGGSVVAIADRGPRLFCPEFIVIPRQHRHFFLPFWPHDND
jgi:polygalacturonase